MIRESNLHWRHEDTESNLVMPWYTLPCLQWLKQQPTKEWTVFEYGTGYSTIWWRLNCKKVDSIDNNQGWAKVMVAFFSDFISQYVESIANWGSQNKYDCVIVDGSWRIECVDFCRKYIVQGGYLIFDNYNQEGFEDKEKIDALLEGWEKTVFKQPNHTDWSTAVFKKV